MMPESPVTVAASAVFSSVPWLQITDTLGPRAIYASNSRQVTATTFSTLLINGRPPTKTLSNVLLMVNATIARVTRYDISYGGSLYEFRPVEEAMNLKIEDVFAERETNRYRLHARHLNEQMVRVLRTIGFDQGYKRGGGKTFHNRNDSPNFVLVTSGG